MGYRHYFYKVNRSDVEKIKNLSINELKKEYGDTDGYVDIHELIPQKKIHEFGKLYYDDTAIQLYETGKPLFNNEDVMECFDNYVPFVVGEEGLLKAIEIYRDKIKRYYKNLLVDGEEKIVPVFGFKIKDKDIKSIDKVKEHLQYKISVWEHSEGIIDINKSNENVTHSWEYEYSIFNLIFLLKTIDWEKETILFYGW